MGHHTEDPTTTADSSDAYRRSEDGRFLPGCQGGPGRQGRFSLAMHRKALMEVCEPEALQMIFLALVRKAKEGSIQAAREVLQLLYGKGGVIPNPVGITPRVETLADIRETAGNLLRAQANGEVNHPDVEALLATLDRALKVAEAEAVDRVEEKLEEVLRRRNG